jgi:hypothetical protein
MSPEQVNENTGNASKVVAAERFLELLHPTIGNRTSK